MKKLLFIAGVAAACSAFAAVETVTGTTEVGMLTINSTATNCVVAVPYLELAGGNICVSNVVKTANLKAGNELYVYENGWTAWVLAEDSTTQAKYWQSVGTATIGVNGVPQVGGNSPEPSSKTLVPGSAIWLIRKDPVGSNPFYVYGGYQKKLETPVTGEIFNLVANPLDAENEIPGAKTGDEIRWIAGNATRLYKKVEAGWTTTKTTVVDKKVSISVLTNSVLKVPAGQGVWYKPTQGRTIKWRD